VNGYGLLKRSVHSLLDETTWGFGPMSNSEERRASDRNINVPQRHLRQVTRQRPTAAMSLFGPHVPLLSKTSPDSPDNHRIGRHHLGEVFRSDRPRPLHHKLDGDEPDPLITVDFVLSPFSWIPTKSQAAQILVPTCQGDADSVPDTFVFPRWVAPLVLHSLVSSIRGIDCNFGHSLQLCRGTIVWHYLMVDTSVQHPLTNTDCHLIHATDLTWGKHWEQFDSGINAHFLEREFDQSCQIVPRGFHDRDSCTKKYCRYSRTATILPCHNAGMQSGRHSILLQIGNRHCSLI
jgi:hypothetical protein